MAQTIPLDRRTVLRRSVRVAGASVALPAFSSLAGCSKAPASLDGRIGLIGAVADRVIPETDTPGAVAAKVPQYIAAVFDQHFTQEQQADFVHGLDAIDALQSGGFEAASQEQQDSILHNLENAGVAASGHATWRQLRDMTIFGFYTSEEATRELAYEEIPGRYNACMPLTEVGRAWLDRGV